MHSDLSLSVDNIKLNIRAGMIFSYQNKVLVEVPKYDFYNSVIPGGRMKIGELSIDAVKREIKEELHFDLVDDKITFVKSLEYLFTFREENYHEIFFVYRYEVDENDYQELLKIKENYDNPNASYKFIDYSEFDKYNLLPLEVRDLIKEI